MKHAFVFPLHATLNFMQLIKDKIEEYKGKTLYPPKSWFYFHFQ